MWHLPATKRTMKILVTCTLKSVCFLGGSGWGWGGQFLSSVALEVLGVSLLWNGYSLSLLKSWIPSLIYCVQDRNKRGVGGSFHRIMERAQKPTQPSPTGRTDLPYIWNTRFLYVPNKCIWCTWEVSVRGRVDGRGIQCRLLALLGGLWADFPNGGFSISGSYILWNIHIKSITNSL